MGRKVLPRIVSVSPDSSKVPIYPVLGEESSYWLPVKVLTISFLSNLVASLMLTTGDFPDTPAPRSQNTHYIKKPMETEFPIFVVKRVEIFLYS